MPHDFMIHITIDINIHLQTKTIYRSMVYISACKSSCNRASIKSYKCTEKGLKYKRVQNIIFPKIEKSRKKLSCIYYNLMFSDTFDGSRIPAAIKSS